MVIHVFLSPFIILAAVVLIVVLFRLTPADIILMFTVLCVISAVTAGIIAYIARKMAPPWHGYRPSYTLRELPVKTVYTALPGSRETSQVEPEGYRNLALDDMFSELEGTENHAEN